MQSFDLELPFSVLKTRTEGRASSLPPPPPPFLFSFGSFMVLWPFGSKGVFLQPGRVCLCVCCLLSDLFFVTPKSRNCDQPPLQIPRKGSHRQTQQTGWAVADPRASFPASRSQRGPGWGCTAGGRQRHFCMLLNLLWKHGPTLKWA